MRWTALAAGLLGGALAAWSELPDRARFVVTGDLLERIYFPARAHSRRPG
jgi:hypothetical protein